MVILLAGASHVGKTALAQRLLEEYHYPYLSIDHLKMGLIRSGNTKLTPLSSEEELTALLWPIVREIVKTAVENGQNLIVEGCYIPPNYDADFSPEYLSHIRAYCLVMTPNYIREHFDDIRAFANVIEKRLSDDFSLEDALSDNERTAALWRAQGKEPILIDQTYEIRL